MIYDRPRSFFRAIGLARQVEMGICMHNGEQFPMYAEVAFERIIT